MNKILLHLLVLLSLNISLHAKMLDGIALIVEGEAITTAEIRAVQTQLHVPKSKAIDLLIQDRLQKVAMKDITVDESLIDQKIKSIAVQNHVTIPKMQKILKQSGTSWIQYRNSIKEAITKEKFFQEVVAPSIPIPTTDELKLYYNNHKKEFMLPSRINLIEYTAPTKVKMDKFIKTNKKTLVTSKRVSKNTKDLEGTLLTMLLSTPSGKYTTAINAGDKFIVYKVVSKSGKTSMPFEIAQPAVTAKWKQEQQSKTLKDYFQKLRTRADIQTLR